MTRSVPDELQRGNIDVPALAARIRSHFPELSFRKSRLDDSGDDHATLILDEAWVFRFPRNAAVRAWGAHERRLLQHLGPISPLPVPDPIFVSDQEGLAGYRMLPGRPLDREVFAGLPSRVQTRCLEQLGDFLACLHNLPPALGVGGPQAWTGEQHAARYQRRRERLASAIPGDLLSRMDRFSAALPDAVDHTPKTLIHGDLSRDHILLAPDANGLAGVIDFTDAGLGDPAFDFTCVWDYGEGAPAHLAASYGRSLQIDAMVERSRWWFARYSIDRLWSALGGARGDELPARLGELSATLAAIGV